MYISSAILILLSILIPCAVAIVVNRFKTWSTLSIVLKDALLNGSSWWRSNMGDEEMSGSECLALVNMGLVLKNWKVITAILSVVWIIGIVIAFNVYTFSISIVLALSIFLLEKVQVYFEYLFLPTDSIQNTTEVKERSTHSAKETEEMSEVTSYYDVNDIMQAAMGSEMILNHAKILYYIAIVATIALVVTLNQGI